MADATVVGRVAIKVMPETKDFRRDAQKTLDRIEQQLHVTAKLKLDLDRTSMEEAKRKLKDEFDKFKTDIKVNADELSRRKVQAQMAFISRDRFARIFPVVDKAAAAKAVATLSALSGIRSMKDLGQDFADWLGNLDRSLPKVAVLGTALLNIGSWALTATSNLFSLSGSLASIGPAALALPGIFGGLAIGTIAWAVAMKDFNQKIPNFAIGLGRTVKAGQAWKKLQDSMSNNFWKGAQKPIQEFINTLFPQFSAGMKGVSTELGGFTGKLATSFKGVFNGPLKQMFSDLSASIAVSATHTDSFAGIIRTLGSVGAAQLPKLAGWFGDISDQFNTWLGKNEATGRLQEFVDNGVKNLKQLGGVISGTSSILAGLARAADKAGGSSLTSLNQTLHDVAAQVNGKTFQTALSNAFRGAHEGIDEITSRSGPAFKSLLIRLSDVLSHNLPRSGKIAGTALNAIFKAFDTKNVSTSLDKVIGNLDKAIRNLAPAVGPAVEGLAGVIRAASELAVTITASIAPAVEKLGPKLASLGDDLQPFIKGLGAVTKLAATVGSGVLSALPNGLIIAVAAMFAFDTITKKVGASLVTFKGRYAAATTGIAAGIPTLRQFGNTALHSAHSVDQLNTYFKQGATKAIASRNAVTAWAKSIGGSVGQVALLGAVTTGLADKMGLSNTASMALAGSFLGPWGAAIGGAIGAVGDLAHAMGSVGDGVTLANRALDSNSTALKRQAVAALEATTAMSAHNILRDGLTVLTQGVGSYKDQLSQAGDALFKLRAQLATPPSGDSFNLLAQGTGLLTGSLAAANNAAVNLDNKIQSLNATLSGRANMRDYKASIDAVSAALTQNGKTLNINSEKGRANQQVLDTIASRALSVAQNLKGADKAKFLEGAQAALASAAGKFNRTDKAAQNLANRLLGFPKKPLPVTFTTPGIEKVKAKVKGTQDLLTGFWKVKPKGNPFAQALTTQLGGLGGKLNTQGKAAGSKAAAGLSSGANKPVKLGKPLASFIAQTNGIKGKAKSQGSDIGNNLGRGAYNGINSWVGPLAAKAASMVRAAVAAARRAGDIRSPSKKMAKIGSYLGQGLIVGLVGERSKVIETMSKLIGALNSSGHKGLASYAGHVQKTLTGLAKTWEDYGSKIAAVTDYTNAVVAQVQQSGSPFGAVQATTFKGMVAVLTTAVSKAKAFATALDALKKLKLNKITFDQLVQAGPDAALQVAQSIAKAGQTGVNSLNQLQDQLNAAAKTTANTAADVMYASGGQIVNGLLAGLKAKQKEIAAQMTAIGNAMVAAIKKALKIKSPSRVMAQVGRYVGDGFIDGVASRTKKSNDTIRKLAVVRPILPSAGGDLAAGGSGSSNVRVINYYAAPGRSVNSKEDLFDALGKARGRF